MFLHFLHLILVSVWVCDLILLLYIYISRFISSTSLCVLWVDILGCWVYYPPCFLRYLNGIIAFNITSRVISWPSLKVTMDTGKIRLIKSGESISNISLEELRKFLFIYKYGDCSYIYIYKREFLTNYSNGWWTRCGCFENNETEKLFIGAGSILMWWSNQ